MKQMKNTIMKAMLPRIKCMSCMCSLFVKKRRSIIAKAVLTKLVPRA